MFISWYYLESKTDLSLVSYTVLKRFSTFVEKDIPTWCYFSTCPKDILTSYVS